MSSSVATFEEHRPALLALGYRMLGDRARAEDAVQEAWVRWQGHEGDVDAPKAFLLTTVARICLDELGSARARREESRGDRLPEPADHEDPGLARVELLDRISLAFLVVLQRLTPAERAAFLLHDVFDMSHGEIGALLGKSDAACRQLLKRARENVAAERRVFQTSGEEHRRLLSKFVAAVSTGDHQAILELLAEDAVLLVDPGASAQRFGRIRDVRRPIVGRVKIAALIRSFAQQEPSTRVVYEERTLNGEHVAIAILDGRVLAAMLVAIADGHVRHILFHADADRLREIQAS